eukprot:TRINITY_DN50015_c0_g1_i1.p1 TRINITY_DN50015_c0_g1~~TRINITY_DN50015_c0_g1_i1.p1  ORF type:complete len:596 (-),score=100.29 TRINITY_DN50015_c0_g1_i1:68-1855(-)
MQALSLVEGIQRRDLAEIVWQIAERRSCNEIVIRYDCGHTLRAEVCAPALPKIQEYGTHDMEKRRFLQHCLHVLTRDPGASQVQLTVPEGRCRHCQRGTRQTLVCGPIHADLREAPPPATAIKAGGRSSLENLTQMAGKRLELPMSTHAFLAAMGKVGRMPDAANVSSPLLTSSAQSILQNPFEGTVLREGIHQWTRREVEEQLESELMKYVCCAAFVLVLLGAECVYLLTQNMGPQQLDVEFAAGNATATSSSVSLSNLTSLSSLELRVANSTWVLAALTLEVHKAFAPSEVILDPRADAGTGETGSNTGYMWSAVVHPLWIAMSIVLAPILWILDMLVTWMAPVLVIYDMMKTVLRNFILHVLFTGVRELVWRPCGLLYSLISSMFSMLRRRLFSPHSAAVPTIPTANPIAAAAVLCVVITMITSPVPLSTLLSDLMNDIASLGVVRRIRRVIFGPQALGPLVDKIWGPDRARDARAKGGVRGSMLAAKTPKDGKGTDRASIRGGEKLQVGKHDDKSGAFVPACFVCLDKPSRYILEPCGHRVVCGDCAVQLVDAATRSRTSEAGERGSHQADRGGGNCPSCSMTITRAMRVF